MSTPLVVSVTDELVAELERECADNPQGFMVETEYVLRLLAERAELKRDAGRYKKLRTVTPYRFKKIQDLAISDGGDVFYLLADRFDAALDESGDGLAKEFAE